MMGRIHDNASSDHRIPHQKMSGGGRFQMRQSKFKTQITFKFQIQTCPAHMIRQNSLMRRSVVGLASA
jgi:hypothetical protein